MKLIVYANATFGDEQKVNGSNHSTLIVEDKLFEDNNFVREAFIPLWQSFNMRMSAPKKRGKPEDIITDRAGGLNLYKESEKILMMF